MPLRLNSVKRFCGKRVTPAKIEEKTGSGEYVFRIHEDNERYYWYGGWLTNVDPIMFPGQFETKEDSVTEDPVFVSDFSDSEENLSDAEKFFYGILYHN